MPIDVADALPTANFKDIEQGSAIFEIIKQENPDFPLMVMEFWTGWFDHWGQPHNIDEVSGGWSVLSGTTPYKQVHPTTRMRSGGWSVLSGTTPYKQVHTTTRMRCQVGG